MKLLSRWAGRTRALFTGRAARVFAGLDLTARELPIAGVLAPGRPARKQEPAVGLQNHGGGDINDVRGVRGDGGGH